jgi:hypothetical protein
MITIGRVLIILVGSCVVSISGCSDGSGPETADAVGTITMDGKPVDGANVIFHPIGTTTNTLASQATTNAEGRFELSTHIGQGKYKRGVVPGEYAVAVSKLDTSAIAKTYAPPTNLLPKKYSNPETSGLKATVVAGRVNVFPFSVDEN